MSDNWIPTTAQVRDFWVSHGTRMPAAKGYSESECAAEFDRWLADHDREVAAQAIEGYREFLERATKTHAYAMDEDDWDEHKRLTAALTAYAARIRVADQNGEHA